MILLLFNILFLLLWRDAEPPPLLREAPPPPFS